MQNKENIITNTVEIKSEQIFLQIQNTSDRTERVPVFWFHFDQRS